VKRLFACLALVVLPLVEFAPGAGAYGGGVCRISGRIAFAPGSATNGQWSIEGGVIDCQGILSGGKNRIVGPGELKGSGSYASTLPAAGGACLQQTGSGTLEYRIPTSGGYLVISEPDSYTLVGVGSFATPTLHGTFEVAPPYTGGDCVTKPPTGAAFVAQAVLYRGVEPRT
jgi:hypothetical protein